MAENQRPDLETQAELNKLGQLLNLSADDLAPLASGGAENLRRYRRRVNQRIFDHHRDRFRRLEKVVRLLPKATVARLAQSAFGPRLSGRVVGEMDPLRAFKIAKRLPPEFLADAALHVDPPRVREIIRQLPAELIRDAALVMVAREDYITLGRFADALSAPAIRAVVGAVHDDAVLLHIAFYMEEKSQLSSIVHMIDNDRVASIMRTGTEKDLWPEALSVVDNVDDELRGRLANIMAEQDEATLDGLVHVAYQQNLWGPVLRGMSRMNPKYHRKIVNLPSVKDETVLGDLVSTAYAEGLLEAALPLAAPMRAEWQKVVAHAALQQGPEVAEAAMWAAHNADQWDVALELFEYTDDSERDMLAQLPIASNKHVLDGLIRTAARIGKLGLLLNFVERMENQGQRAAAELSLANDGELLESILDAARTTEGGWAAVAVALSTVGEDELSHAAQVYHRQSEEDRAAFQAAAREKGVWDVLAPALEGAAA